MLSNVKFTVTVSPASIAPFGGEKLSAITAAFPGAIAAVPVSATFNVVRFPLLMKIPVLVTGR